MHVCFCAAHCEENRRKHTPHCTILNVFFDDKHLVCSRGIPCPCLANCARRIFFAKSASLFRRKSIQEPLVPYIQAPQGPHRSRGPNTEDALVSRAPVKVPSSVALATLSSEDDSDGRELCAVL